MLGGLAPVQMDNWDVEVLMNFFPMSSSDEDTIYVCCCCVRILLNQLHTYCLTVEAWSTVDLKIQTFKLKSSQSK